MFLSSKQNNVSLKQRAFSDTPSNNLIFNEMGAYHFLTTKGTGLE
jgi:hypothetical protein